MLALEIEQRALHGFLAEALPMAIGRAVTGIPGLRPHPTRTHLDLLLVGPQGRTDALVRLRGVTKQQWREAERRLGKGRTRLWLAGFNALHNDEIAALRHQKVSEPIPLLSALLRRMPLWRHATWLGTEVDERSLCLYWRDGPTDTRVAEMLKDSLCGITGVTVVSLQLSDEMRGVAFALGEGSHQDEELLSSILAAPLTVDSMWTRIRTALKTPCEPGSPVPREVWDLPPMRDALARREISSVYRLLRRHGVSQRQIAALTGQSQSEVSEILKGRQVMAYDVLTRIACGLGVPRGHIGLAFNNQATPNADTPHPEEDESVKRRKFLAHAAAVTVGAAVLGTDSGSWVSHPTQTPAPGRIGMTDVRQLEAATRALRALANEYDADAARGAIDTNLAYAEKLLSVPGPEGLKDRLKATIADLRALARCAT